MKRDAMRILALNFNQKGMGTYCRSYHFSRELARAGHHVTLVTVSRHSRFRRAVSWKRDWIGECDAPHGEGPWIRLIEGPSWGNRALPGWGSAPLDIWGRIRELQFGEYHAVLGFEHHPNVSWPVYLTRRWKKFRFISDWCDWFGGSSNYFRGWKLAHRIDTHLEEKIRHAADRVSVTSRLLFERALSIGILRQNVTHIPQGAPTDYVFPLDQNAARSRLNIPEKVPIVLAVRNGDMCREILIFDYLLRRVPKAKLLILGNASSSASALAERLGISSHIISAGWVSDEDYPFYLACADVCFCPLEPYRNDCARWPAKILDFLSAGRATVTNAVGEVETLFRKSHIGVLAEHDSESFAESIAQLLTNRQDAHALGARARQVMVAEWDWRIRGPQINQVVTG